MIFPNIAASWSRIFYGWRMIGLVSAIRVVGGGIHQYGFTVFFLPISQDLGMSRAATSLAFSLARAQGAIEAPLVGYLIDRSAPSDHRDRRVSRRRGLHSSVMGGELCEFLDRLSRRDLPRVHRRICPFADGHRQQLVYPSTSARHDRRQRWEISTAASTSQRFAAC